MQQVCTDGQSARLLVALAQSQVGGWVFETERYAREVAVVGKEFVRAESVASRQPD